MTNNKAHPLNEVKKIQTKILHLERLTSSINQTAKEFNQFFPKNTFGENEKTLITAEIETMKADIVKISRTIEKGETLSIDLVTNTIKEAWGRTKLKITVFNLAENDDDFEHAQNIFQKSGITVDKNEIQIIEYYLNTNSRSELHMVRAFLAPGFSYATFDTGRVGWNTEVLTNNKFLKQVAAEVDTD